MEQVEIVPENVLLRAAKAVEGIIPIKSRSIYDKEYSRFEQWMEENSLKIINETVMLAYFQELVCFYYSYHFEFHGILIIVFFTV